LFNKKKKRKTNINSTKVLKVNTELLALMSNYWIAKANVQVAKQTKLNLSQTENWTVHYV